MTVIYIRFEGAALCSSAICHGEEQIMRHESEMLASYGQIAVFRPDQPLFNLWTDEHVAQGFAWRPDCAAFGVPDHDGMCLVCIETIDEMKAVADDAIAAIRLPYEVRENKVGIGSISDEVFMSIPSGIYDINFELLPSFTLNGETYGFLIKLSFCLCQREEFKIIRKGGDMTSDHVLRQDADIAY